MPPVHITLAIISLINTHIKRHLYGGSVENILEISIEPNTMVNFR